MDPILAALKAHAEKPGVLIYGFRSLSFMVTGDIANLEDLEASEIKNTRAAQDRQRRVSLTGGFMSIKNMYAAAVQ